MWLSTARGAEEISETTISALQTKWPTKNVRSELDRAHLWLLRNAASRPANVWRFIDNWLRKCPDVRKPQPTIVEAWWTTEARTINYARSLGMEARPGESMEQFRDRIRSKAA